MGYVYKHEPKSKLPEDKGQYVVNQYSIHHRTTEELGKELGLSPLIILRALKRSGVSLLPKHQYPFTTDEEDDIAKRYENGECSTHTLAKEYGCSHGVIARVLREKGVAMKPRTRKTKYGSKILSEKLKERWESGELDTRPSHPQTQETRDKIREANTGEKNYRWKGGRAETARGYVLVKIPENYPYAKPAKAKGYMPEHRFIMEMELGRALDSTELVHHKNGIKNDNRLENLELLTYANHHGEVTCPHCQNNFQIK